MQHRKHTKLVAALAAVLALAATGTALAATSEQSNVAGMPPGYLKINAATCHFLHPEIDQATGPSWLDLRRNVIWEDARTDVKLSCLTHRPAKTAAPDTDGVVGYTSVEASGTTQTVTVSCPAGDVVMGGGSDSETTGSWPSSDTSWSVSRDHLSPTVLKVFATCAKAAS